MTAPDVLLSLIVVAIPIEVVASILSTRYLRRLYLGTPVPRSFIFRSLGLSSTIQTTVGLYLAYAVIAGILRLFRMADLPVVPPPWAMIVAGVAIIVLLAAPIWFAIVFYLFRKGHDGVYDPPKSNGDSGGSNG